jgi:hypothetical protein
MQIEISTDSVETIHSRSCLVHNLAIQLVRPEIMYKITLIVLSALLVSCASARPTPDAFEDAELAIQAALRVGAEEHAPVELRFAREKLAEARKGEEYKQWDKAIVLIEESEINSELAIEKTRTAEIRNEVTELSRQNEILREDFERTYGESPE